MKLGLQYSLKPASNPSNPAYDCVFDRKYEDLYLLRHTVIPPFGIRIAPDLDCTELDLDQISKFTVPAAPPWQLAQPTVLFDINTHKKSDTNPAIFHAKYCEIKEKYSNYMAIYTDGSKEGDKVGAAFAVPELSRDMKSRLRDKSIIFSAELRPFSLPSTS